MNLNINMLTNSLTTCRLKSPSAFEMDAVESPPDILDTRHGNGEFRLSKPGVDRGLVIMWPSRPLDPARIDADFWKSHSLESLAAEQGVPAITPLEKFAGIWPEDQLDDGFEEEVRRWRAQGRPPP